MSSKSKGMDAERDLIHKFWSTGKWCAVRVAGSGSMKYPNPDLIVGNKIRRLAIECKSISKNKKYLDKHDVEQLKEFCDIFSAEPWFAIKFPKMEWLFLSLEDVEKTENGYVIDAEVAKRRGLLIEELIR